jgi:type VI secretion system protein ImpG
MSEALYPYYERELLFIRQLAQDFARQYPAAAGRLLLEPNRSVDPHVERLIESFALLSARVQNKLDDEFPELTDSLLSVLYPHYLAPVPSMAMLQFDLDMGRGQLPAGFTIPRHSKLRSQSLGDLSCTFRTGYPVTLWPIVLTDARLMPPPFPSQYKPPPRTAAALRLQFECQAEMNFKDLAIERLRLFLFGENPVTTTLYEFLLNHTLQVLFRPLGSDARQHPFTLAPEKCLTTVGFDRDDALLAYPNQSFIGYRLLTEYFAYPHKFLYLDVGGWNRVREAGFEKRMEVIVFLSRTQPNLEQTIDAGTFRLGCTPVVNLFEQTAEPIALSEARYEYRVLPDVAHPQGMEVYSVESVTSVDPVTNTTAEYQPFYSFKHGASRDSVRTFWYASRKPSSTEGDRGTEVYLTLVDLDFDPRLPAEKTLVVRTMCTNRDLPIKLQQFGEAQHFELEAGAPISRVRCLRTPTAPLRPPLRRGAHWRLVSHLSLNHLSLSDPLEGRQALQEILRLYDFTDPEAGQHHAAIVQQIIDGILSVSSRRIVGRTGAPTSSGFCRGTEVTIEFDEQKYLGSGLFLFACVLERFLGLYVSINSFSQLIARTKQGEGYLKKWPPRTGEQPLL